MPNSVANAASALRAHRSVPLRRGPSLPQLSRQLNRCRSEGRGKKLAASATGSRRSVPPARCRRFLSTLSTPIGAKRWHGAASAPGVPRSVPPVEFCRCLSTLSTLIAAKRWLGPCLSSRCTPMNVEAGGHHRCLSPRVIPIGARRWLGPWLSSWKTPMGV